MPGWRYVSTGAKSTDSVILSLEQDLRSHCPNYPQKCPV